MADGNDERRYGRDQSYGYRPRGPGADRERGYDRGEDLSYNRDRGYGDGAYRAGRVDYGKGRDDRDTDHDRGFFDRAGDEVRSWFGDEEAERRRRYDERESARADRDDRGRETSGRMLPISDLGGGLPSAGNGFEFRDDPSGPRPRSRHEHDPHYREWRDRQMERLDSDYDEYRRENQSRFEQDFGGWRDTRETQRKHLTQAREHQDVVGSDGAHVGTVDHVRGDRILLTKTDKDAGGHHHSIPVSWIEKVDDKVHIRKTADEAHRAWKDEQDNPAFRKDAAGQGGDGPHVLNRSFSGTY